MCIESCTKPIVIDLMMALELHFRNLRYTIRSGQENSKRSKGLCVCVCVKYGVTVGYVAFCQALVLYLSSTAEMWVSEREREAEWRNSPLGC